MSATVATPLRAPLRTARGRSAATNGLEASLIATVAPLLRHLLAHARRHAGWKGGLTYQQYNVLRVVDAEGPSSPAGIARHLLVTAPVVTRLAATLVEAGLLERSPDPGDRRAVRLGLTPAGRRRVRAMRRDLLEAARELLEPLPEERRSAVATALDELQILLPKPKHSAARR
ncbi:MAG: MarR family winged helix-turn-helix transcriptional regulator [Candidatus Limnocylindria bacterium]